jgi:5-methylcytosine-specific restriction endonuclease McrA
VRRSVLRRRTPLAAGAQPLRRSDAPLRRSPLKRGSGSSERPEGPLTPGEWRYRVWVADHGHCVLCRRWVPLRGGLFVWQAHHVVPKERLRREGLYHLVWDEDNGMTLCFECHGTVESGVPPIAFPVRLGRFLGRLGQMAPRLVDRGTLA